MKQSKRNGSRSCQAKKFLTSLTATCLIGLGTQAHAFENCTYTQGYWKNHGALWPLSISVDTQICGESWLENLLTPVRGDKFYIVSHQYIAASLNLANGADAPEEVLEALTLAETALADCEITPAEEEVALAAKDILDAYNNGAIGPGHCSDEPKIGNLFKSCSPLEIKFGKKGGLDLLKINGKLAGTQMEPTVYFELRNSNGVIAEGSSTCEFITDSACQFRNKEAKFYGGVERHFAREKLGKYQKFQLFYYGNLGAATLPGMCLRLKFGTNGEIQEMCGDWFETQNGWKLPLPAATSWE